MTSASPLPDVLFRFRSGNNLGRVLQDISCVHWLAAAEHLNDPFDGIAGLPVRPVNEVRTWIGRLENEEDSREFRTQYRGHMKWMVACFTSQWQSVSMWANYGSSGAGFCLVYDPRMVVERLREHQRRDPAIGPLPDPLVGPVKYMDRLPPETAATQDRVFSKAVSWASEEEWRVAVLGFEDASMPGGTMINLRAAITKVLIGWAAGSEVYTPTIDAVNKLRDRGEDVQVGIVRLDHDTRALRVDWPWGDHLRALGSNTDE